MRPRSLFGGLLLSLSAWLGAAHGQAALGADVPRPLGPPRPIYSGGSPPAAPEEVPAPASAPVTAPAPAPEKAPAPAPAPAPPPPAGKPPSDLAAGLSGKVGIHALMQAWVDTNPSADKFDQEPEATFRIRRAELRLSGEIVPSRVGYVVMADLAKALFKLDKPVTITNPDGSTTTVQGVQGDNLLPLRDMYTVVKTEHVDFWLGQFKIPASLEGVTSPAQLLFPERSIVAKAFGDKRDLGVKAEKRKEKVYYGLSLYNGAGENRFDTDATKEAAGRVEYTPKLGEKGKLLLGVVGMSSIGPAEQQHKQLIEGDMRLELGGFLAQAELISTLTRSAADADGVQTDKRGLGYYVSSAYSHPAGFQVAARFGMLDPDMKTAPEEDSGQMSEAGAALNYFFARNKKKETNLFSEHPEFHEAKLQLSYSRFTPTSPDHAITDELILALQSWF